MHFKRANQIFDLGKNKPLYFAFLSEIPVIFFEFYSQKNVLTEV